MKYSVLHVQAKTYGGMRMNIARNRSLELNLQPKEYPYTFDRIFAGRSATVGEIALHKMQIESIKLLSGLQL